ncbi:MAG: SURF1 family cytochrome oxidase biogenesis protein [Maricaulaceae bacterium]|jgi:surfeit locus 1 family protein
MTFRPLPVMTLLAIPALALLIALGVWQLGRAEEKRVEMAAYLANAAVAGARAQPLCSPAADIYGVAVDPPEGRSGEEVRFIGRSRDGEAGWRVLRLAPAPDCLGEDKLLVVQTAFLTNNDLEIAAQPTLTAAAPPRAGGFTPENDPARGDYYRFAPEELAVAFGVEVGALITDLWLIDTSPGPPERLAAMPPSRHLGYAWTWFGLAGTLVAVYVAYHVREGRFSKN